MASCSMRSSAALALAPLALATGVSPVHAQAGGLSQSVTISFTGTVGADPASTIQIRQPDGTLAPYAGPVPADFPYRAGDQVKIGFQATVPTAACFQQQAAQGAAVPADGVYHLQVACSNGSAISPHVIGGATSATISGMARGRG